MPIVTVFDILPVPVTDKLLLTVKILLTVTFSAKVTFFDDATVNTELTPPDIFLTKEKLSSE